MAKVFTGEVEVPDYSRDTLHINPDIVEGAYKPIDNDTEYLVVTVDFSGYIQTGVRRIYHYDQGMICPLYCMNGAMLKHYLNAKIGDTFSYYKSKFLRIDPTELMQCPIGENVIRCYCGYPKTYGHTFRYTANRRLICPACEALEEMEYDL